MQLRMSIAMVDPEPAEKRKSVAPEVAQLEIAKLAGPLRERTIAILDALPIGEVFGWVHAVSIPLTTAMIATLFDFPWDERHKLPEWSDWAARIDIGPDPVLNATRERHCFDMAARFKQCAMSVAPRRPKPICGR